MKALLRLCRHQWDRVGAALLVVGGLVGVLSAWYGVRETIFTFRQVPYLLSGGLLGICLVAIGLALWISADIRDEWAKLDRIEAGMTGATVDLTNDHHEVDVDDAFLEQARAGSLRVSKG